MKFYRRKWVEKFRDSFFPFVFYPLNSWPVFDDDPGKVITYKKNHDSRRYPILKLYFPMFFDPWLRLFDRCLLFYGIIFKGLHSLKFFLTRRIKSTKKKKLKWCEIQLERIRIPEIVGWDMFLRKTSASSITWSMISLIIVYKVCLKKK